MDVLYYLMKIRIYQHKEQCFNYLDLFLCIPIIEINKCRLNTFEEYSYTTQICMNTKICWSKEDVGWYFCFVILGFGIALNRQYSY